MSNYRVPQLQARAEFEERRSRFIAFLEPVASRSESLIFLEALKLRYPDARHHCWAYVVGDPSSASEQAFSDDGEPIGTAGKPILNVLQHRLVGNCIVVVVRYFGGIKLGAGGLVRAYSSAVNRVVEAATLIDYVVQCEQVWCCDYDQESLLRHLLESVGGDILSVCYSGRVEVKLKIPISQQSLFSNLLSDRGGGRIELQDS